MEMCFQELEENLSGRIKSVLLVALSALLLVCCGKMQTAVSGVNAAAAVIAWEQQNPIDIYFQTREKAPCNEKQQYAYALIYQECWEKELAHAYELLGSGSQPFFVAHSQAMEALEQFRRYVRAQGSLTDNRIFAETELIKGQALRLYRQIQENQEKQENGVMQENGEMRESLFVFSRKEAEEMLIHSGIAKTP